MSRTVGSVVIRDYRPGDARALMELFHETVHAICASDYSPEQLAAWSPESGLKLEEHATRFDRTRPFVAEDGKVPVGFLELESDGHVDRLYVHRDRQRQGIGSRLLDHAIEVARNRSLPRLHAEVAINAVAFFESRGFTIVRPQEIERNGRRFRNFVMERRLVVG